MAKHEELLAEFSFEKNVFGTGEARTVIGVCEDGTVVRGKAEEGELQTGLTFLFRGFWTQHEKYGKQFQFYSFGIAQPSGQRGTVSYLQRGPFIGRKRAIKIWELYGPESLDAIRERPEEVAAKVKGLTEQQAREAAAYFKAHKDREKVTRDLEELLSGGGFPKKLIDKLIEKWGARAAETVREQPFKLMGFYGCGFGRADKLYLSLGLDPAAPCRLGWCGWDCLHRDRTGSTWLPIQVASMAIAKSVAGVKVNPQAVIDWAIENGHIAVRRVRDGENGREKVWVAEGARAAAELRLANQVHRARAES